MASALQQFFVTLALQLREGRIAELADAHSAPLVVALPGVDPGYVVLSSREQLEHFFRLECEGLHRAGMGRLLVDVTETRTEADRLTAWVEWYALTRAGARSGQTTARYYLERRGASFTIQMIEFERIAFPMLVDWFHAAGDSADAPPATRLH